jgi:hypothetical protein
MIKLFKAFDGWKTAIAAIYWPVSAQVIPLWFENGLTGNAYKVWMTIGVLLTATGVGHKWYKKSHSEE